MDRVAETADVEACSACGVPRPAGAAWCPRCLERYDGRNRAGGYAGPLRPAVGWSRVDAGATSFGLIGRTLLTIVVVVPLLVLWFDLLVKGQVVWIVLWAVPGTAIGAYVLRDVWRREKVIRR